MRFQVTYSERGRPQFTAVARVVAADPHQAHVAPWRPHVGDVVAAVPRLHVQEALRGPQGWERVPGRPEALRWAFRTPSGTLLGLLEAELEDATWTS